MKRWVRLSAVAGVCTQSGCFGGPCATAFDSIAMTLVALVAAGIVIFAVVKFFD